VVQVYFSSEIIIHKKMTLHTYERRFGLVIMQSFLIDLLLLPI